MKRLLAFFVILVLLVPTFGCGKREMTVTIVNLCDEAIYAVRMEYAIGDDAVGGREVSLSPENDAAIPAGEELHFRFTKQDLPENADLRGFRFEIFLLLEDGTEVSVGTLGVAAAWGGEYVYSVVGDSEKGFRFQRGNRSETA